MSVDVDLYKFDYNKLVSGLKFFGVDDQAKLEKILNIFGFRFGDTYIILCDEHTDWANSYYNLGQMIDETFGLDDSFDVIVNLGELLEAHKTIEDAGGEMNEAGLQ